MKKYSTHEKWRTKIVLRKVCRRGSLLRSVFHSFAFRILALAYIMEVWVYTRPINQRLLFFFKNHLGVTSEYLTSRSKVTPKLIFKKIKRRVYVLRTARDRRFGEF